MAYPWGEKTYFVPKIYSCVGGDIERYYYYGAMKLMADIDSYSKDKYPPKWHQIVPYSEGEKWLLGDRIHFALNNNHRWLRFCPSVPVVFKQDIEIVHERKGIQVFIDGFGLTKATQGLFLEGEGLPDMSYLERMYPTDFRGWLIHWGYKVYN